MIQVKNLSFSYTKQPFISDMSFSVSSGEIFGFLGQYRLRWSALFLQSCIYSKSPRRGFGIIRSMSVWKWSLVMPCPQ